MVKSVNPKSQDWSELLNRSHQTSFYVLPEVLELEKLLILGYYEGGRLTTGLVARSEVVRPVYIPYQGFLLDRRNNATSMNALTKAALGTGGMTTIWNPPSLVDLRPVLDFDWQIEIGYTYFIEKVSALGSIEAIEKDDKTLDALARDDAFLKRLLLIEPVRFYRLKDTTVAWGTDRQRRGYYITGAGPELPALVQTLAARHVTSDLAGTPGWAKAMEPKLRTYYGLVRV
jgi:hypothetical protein